MINILLTSVSVFWTLVATLIFMPRATLAQSKNGLCMTEPEFTNVSAMGQTAAERLQAIRDWLDGLVAGSPSNSFLKGRNPDGSNYTFIDLDGNPTDPAQEISNAAGMNNINPRVLLATLRKEKPEVFRFSERPADRALQTLAGCGTSPTARQQIQCMGQKFKEYYYDRLAQCNATIGGWNIDLLKQTGDTPGEEKDASGNVCSVEPESKGVAALFQYTPWIGRALGCGYSPNPLYPNGVGGNGLYCQFWNQHGWDAPPSTDLKVSLQNPTLSCPGAKCVSLNASGGTPPYSWTTNKPISGAGAFTLQVTGVHQQNARFRPPANLTNWGNFNAYARAGFNKSCGNTSWVCTNGQLTQNCAVGAYARGYGCSDQITSENINLTNACGPGIVPINMTVSYCSSDVGNRPVRGSCGFTLEQCNGYNYSMICSGTGVEIFTRPRDLRSQPMKDAGCRPCLLEMLDATVTVTDSAQPPHQVTVNVNSQ
jgi:hypothetical protein